MLIDKKLFPFPTIRDQQKQIIDELNKLDDTKKFIFIQAGTGVGKSALAVSICRTLGKGFILTTTKQLQDQYNKDFNKLSFTHIMGQSNYNCNEPGYEKLTVDNAICVFNNEYKCEAKGKNECVYYALRGKANNSEIFCTNYHFFFRNCSCGKWVKNRDVMIFDEAHRLEDILVDFAGFDFNPVNIINKFFNGDESLLNLYNNISPNDNDETIFRKFSNIYEDLIVPRYEELNAEIADCVKNKEFDKATLLNTEFRELDRLYKKGEYFLTTTPDKWVMSFKEIQSKNIKGYYSHIQPLFAGDVFYRFLYNKDAPEGPKANKFVFMSATILDEKQYAQTLGLPDEECAFINFESPFDPSLSPIYKANVVTNYNTIRTDNYAKVICEYVKRICDRHKGQKGIIHTGNQTITRILLDNFKNDNRFLFRIDDVTNDMIYERHINSTSPTILVSSSLIEGADLYDDLSRFQIICKLPYLSLDDLRISKLSKQQPRWYTLKMWARLIQACGRSTRSEKDSSVTYILDAAFNRELSRDTSFIPKYFKDRIK